MKARSISIKLGPPACWLSSIMVTMFLVDSSDWSVTVFCCRLNLSRSLSAIFAALTFQAKEFNRQLVYENVSSVKT